MAVSDGGGLDPSSDADGVRSRIPSVDRLFGEVLRSIADGQLHEVTAVVDLVSDQLGLDAETRSLRNRSGMTVIENRVRWAVTNLGRAGLLEQPRASAIMITDDGSQVLDTVDGPIDRAFLRAARPGFASWLADMGGELPEDERAPSGDPTVWMVRAGRGGAHAPTFVERSAVIVGWGATGDVSELSHEALLDVVAHRFPGVKRHQRGQMRTCCTAWRTRWSTAIS